MNDDERPEPDPVGLELTADTRGFSETMRVAEADVLFAFHPDLSTHAEREARNRLLRAVSVGLEFQDQMRELQTQAVTAPEDVQRLREGVLRMGGSGKERT